MDYTAIAAILTASAALLGVFYNAVKQKQELQQAAKRYDLEALRYVVDDLTDENARLRDRVKDFELQNDVMRDRLKELGAQIDSKTKRIQDLEAQVAVLEAQVKELGDTPRRARRGTGPLGD
jgi:septal ring factor EnvC (AmiA/AmiB activator)